MKVTTTRGSDIEVVGDTISIRNYYADTYDSYNMLDFPLCSASLQLTKAGEYFVRINDGLDGINAGRYADAYTAGALIAAVMHAYRATLPTRDRLSE